MVEAAFDASAFGASAFVASAFGASAFVASDFIASEEEDPDGEAGGEADGLLEPGLELDGDGDCAMADDSINPLSAVVSNSFFNIGKTSMHVVFCGDGVGARLFVRGLENRPSFQQRLNARRCSARNCAR
jgi:hypothetical protein